MDWMSRGSVWLGVDKKLPRTPSVFERKLKWRLSYKARDPIATEAANYVSAKDRPEVLEAQFEEDMTDGMMQTMSTAEATSEFGSRLVIAAQGALIKSLEPGAE
jgi:hypothetical protein